MIRSAAKASMPRTRSASAPFSTSSRSTILSSVIARLRFGERCRNPNLPKIGGGRPRRRRPRAALRQGLRARPLTPRRGPQPPSPARQRRIIGRVRVSFRSSASASAIWYSGQPFDW
jgi:hypothetical protein